MPKSLGDGTRTGQGRLTFSFRSLHVDGAEIIAAARDLIARGQINGPVQLHIFIYARDAEELDSIESGPYYSELVINALGESHGLVETDIEDLFVRRRVGITRGIRINLAAEGFEVRA